MDNLDALRDRTELQQLTDIIETCQVFIPEVDFQPSPMVDDATLTRFVRSLCIGRPKESAMVETLVFQFGEALPRQIEMIFSALPLITINALELCSVRGTLGRQGWAWLAYVLFHPWARYSRLNILNLRDADVSDPEAAVLRSVIVAQTTLYSLLHGVDDDTAVVAPPDTDDQSCGRYAMVSVREVTVCFVSSELRGKRWCVFKKQSFVTAVIKQATNEADELEDAVCVIVSGFAHGWIAKSAILDLVREPAENASVGAMALQTLGPLLKSVSFLDIFQWGQLKSTQMLELLAACNSLTKLTVRHRGDVFSTWTPDTLRAHDREELRLETLNLVCYENFGPICPPSPAAWQSVLSELENFVVHTLGPRQAYEEEVRRFLHDGYSVERFLWSSYTRKGVVTQISYDKKRIATRELLQIETGRNDKAQRPMNLRSRAAFTSAIHHKGKLSEDKHALCRRPMGCLSQDVTRLTCGFSTVDTDRIVWVDDR